MVAAMALRAACLLVCLQAGAAQAQCRLALVLAMDVSSSVDAAEYDLQRLGLAAALNSTDVREAVLHGAPGSVALSVYEWSGRNQQKTHLDWQYLRNDADIDRAVATLSSMTRGHDDFPTALGHGIAYGTLLLQRGPDCARRVLDVSGDGVNNHGYGPRDAYRHFPMQRVTVNGLVILDGTDGVFDYYQNEVRYGPAAFVETADGFAEFETAMTRKLIRELAGLSLSQDAPAPEISIQ